ncbi:MAG TPA: DUF308 domain-containing protein [Candidatus Coprovivens excrementavium]|nr:DUF308 domain-containing protein [Candidatus Coprovivens excrementavium]
MEIKVKSYSSQSSLINAIIFFILGAILFSSADKVISFISISLGIILVVIAIIELIIYIIEQKKEDIIPKKSRLIFCVIATIFAIIFIFFSEVVEQFIRFIIGAWILFSGIMRFINALSINNKSRKFIPLLITSILLMIVGVYTIVIGDIILSTIGIIMMIYAVIEITGFIFYTKDTTKPEEPGTTTLIIQEEQEEQEEQSNKKKKKIKDVKEKKKKA